MSYLETSVATRYPWYIRLLFRLQRRRYGRELEPTRRWGRTPRVFLAMAAMYAALDRRSSPLPPALRSLVQVRVSQINWCAFCVDLNAATCLKRGITEKSSAHCRSLRSRHGSTRAKRQRCITRRR